MECPSCGSDVGEQNFCPECGEPVSKSAKKEARTKTFYSKFGWSQDKIALANLGVLVVMFGLMLGVYTSDIPVLTELLKDNEYLVGAVPFLSLVPLDIYFYMKYFR